MIEVFKTNVKKINEAAMLVMHIQQAFVNYQASFDLEDCDRILRVKSTSGDISVPGLIKLLQHFGYQAEVLPD